MELKLGPRIVASYKRLAYTSWDALAEFVDNSTQAFFNNREILEPVLEEENENLRVEIKYYEDDEEYIEIIDNSIGMSEEELKNAVIVGKPPEYTGGRSRYGLGLKTAACWLGDFWTVRTKKYSNDKEHYIEIDVPQIAQGNMDLNHTEEEKPQDDHYTIITIKNLNRNFYGRTKGKIKDYLRSMYRVDLNTYGLKLLWEGEKLEWNQEEIEDRLLTNTEGELVKREFEIEVDGKLVEGWAGVFESGSKADAGFSIIQSKRVIQGWPDSYRPQTLFGSQEGGSNSLVNQRLVGELHLEDFEVSHTKDEILFTDQQEDELEAKLLQELGDLKDLARSYRKYNADEREPSEVETDSALNNFQEELESNEIIDLLEKDIPSENLIKQINESIKETIVEKIDPSIDLRVGSVNVSLYIVGDMSPNDPYVIVEATENKHKVIVIVNKSHPHWRQLNDEQNILNFLRHCTYDGVAEWKAFFKVGNLNPDTIKEIKDDLLRLPFEIEDNSIKTERNGTVGEEES